MDYDDMESEYGHEEESTVGNGALVLPPCLLTGDSLASSGAE